MPNTACRQNHCRLRLRPRCPHCHGFKENSCHHTTCGWLLQGRMGCPTLVRSLLFIKKSVLWVFWLWGCLCGPALDSVDWAEPPVWLWAELLSALITVLFKQYLTEGVTCAAAGGSKGAVNPKTYRKFAKPFMEALSSLEHVVVSCFFVVNFSNLF